jgi:pimeloyl-ACP methyl ester carboxylesterase
LKLKARWLFISIFIVLILFCPTSVNSRINPSDDEITLESVEVDGETQFYNLYVPSNPIGAVLIIPSLTNDHYELLPDMGNSLIVKAAMKYQLALVFAQGAVGDWYSPDNGEKKVLACLSDANATLNISSDSWFIYGFSMGGAGAITISLRHPGLFAGLYVGDGTVWGAIQVPYYWDDEVWLQLDPLQNVEFFRNKTLFLASGTNNGTYFRTNIRITDTFSEVLTTAGIDHYYYRGDEPHSTLLLYNSLNLTFDMFSHHIAGTLDQFYEDHWPHTTTTTATTTQTTSSTITPAWMINVPFIALFVLIFQRKRR